MMPDLGEARDRLRAAGHEPMKLERPDGDLIGPYLEGRARVLGHGSTPDPWVSVPALHHLRRRAHVLLDLAGERSREVLVSPILGDQHSATAARELLAAAVVPERALRALELAIDEREAMGGAA